MFRHHAVLCFPSSEQDAPVWASPVGVFLLTIVIVFVTVLLPSVIAIMLRRNDTLQIPLDSNAMRPRLIRCRRRRFIQNAFRQTERKTIANGVCIASLNAVS